MFSIHNVAFQGQFSDTVMEDILGVAHIPAAATQLRCDACSINYMLGALHYADAITTVSPTYAGEIQTPEFGEGLDGVLRERSYALQGILNGIDVAAFDPATDKRIAANYTVDDRSGKAVCKAKLQEELGLEVRDDRPLMVMVTRLTRQKGMDLVMYALDRILSGGVQVAVLGTGDRDYEDGLRYFQDKYPGTMAARIEFDPALSQRMYAAADMFLMPSKFEPCGLSQIIAMRYGTLPIVRETGGLKDTVIPYNEFTGEGTGFSFSNFNGDEMGDAVFRAARLFWDNREAWNKLVTQAMSQDFSWTRSADKYLDLYFFMHPEIERPAAVAEVAAVDEPAAAEAEPAATVKEPAAAEAEPAATVKEPAAVEEPKAEEKPAAEAEVKPAAKPAAKKTTTRKTTAKKATTTKAAASKTSAAKGTTAKHRLRASYDRRCQEGRRGRGRSRGKGRARGKGSGQDRCQEDGCDQDHDCQEGHGYEVDDDQGRYDEGRREDDPEGCCKARRQGRGGALRAQGQGNCRGKAGCQDHHAQALYDDGQEDHDQGCSSQAEAKAEPAKEAPISPAVPAEEKAPTKKTSVRKATATRKRH